MNREILDFQQDDSGEWVAQLSCGHAQHVRHQPPFRLAPWVLDDAQRAARVGSSLDCPLCDRAELPEGLRVARRSERWNANTVPMALLRAHRVPAGMWGRLRVEHGRLRFRAETDPPLDVVVGPDTAQAIPPDVAHHVELLGEVQFFLELLRR